MILIFVSFILDGLLSKYLTNIFLPLLTLSSLILIYPYCKSNKCYFILTIITGILYDIAYTDVFLTTMLFPLICFIITSLSKYFMDNLFNTIVSIVLSIILYRISSYIIYILFSNGVFNGTLLFQSIYSSLITNIIYSVLVYIILYKIKNKTV